MQNEHEQNLRSGIGPRFKGRLSSRDNRYYDAPYPGADESDVGYGENTSGGRLRGYGYQGAAGYEGWGYGSDFDYEGAGGFDLRSGFDYEGPPGSSFDIESRQDYAVYQGSEADLGFRGTGPKGYSRADQSIHEEVCERLADAELDPSDVSVSVEKGAVRLSGSVDSRRAKRQAEDIAYQTRGVKDVRNGLRVASGQQSAGPR